MPRETLQDVHNANTFGPPKTSFTDNFREFAARFWARKTANGRAWLPGHSRKSHHERDFHHIIDRRFDRTTPTLSGPVPDGPAWSVGSE